MTNLTAMPMPVADTSFRRASVSTDARHAAIFGMPSLALCTWSHATTNAVVTTSALKARKAYGARWLGESST